jgi:hypothetical protein
MNDEMFERQDVTAERSLLLPDYRTPVFSVARRGGKHWGLRIGDCGLIVGDAASVAVVASAPEVAGISENSLVEPAGMAKLAASPTVS